MRKTQIRRIMKVQPPGEGFQLSRLVDSTDRADKKNIGKTHWVKRSENGLLIVESHNVYFNCPFGSVGERLWGREKHATSTKSSCAISGTHYEKPWYYADADIYGLLGHDGFGPVYTEELSWKPSTHMPRYASRILLEITGVRVERLNDISEEDAVSEGMFFTDYGRSCFHGLGPVGDVGDCHAPEHTHPQRPGWSHSKTTHQDQCYPSAKWAFVNLWKKINGAESWDLNPWVWVIEFKILEVAK